MVPRRLLDEMEREIPERMDLALGYTKHHATIRVYSIVRLDTDQNELYADY